MKKVYIITGANGFLGNNIVRKLLETTKNIRVLVLPNDKINSINNLECEIYYGDITKSETLKDIFTKREDEEFVVIHCAAFVYIKSKPNSKVFEVNVNGTRNIANKCLETNSRLIYVNSVHSIPEPKDDKEIVEISEFNQDLVEGIYAKSKAEAGNLVLDYVRNKNLNATIIQPSGIIGPGDYGMTHMTRLMLELAKQKLPAIVNGGYDFVDVRDVVNGIISAIDNGKVGECYILSNRYVTIEEIAKNIYKNNGNSKIPMVLPISLVKIVAPICEKYYNMRKKVPLFTKYSLYTLQAKSNFSHKKATNELGYTTRSLEETINDTIKWFIDTYRIEAKSKSFKSKGLYEDALFDSHITIMEADKVSRIRSKDNTQLSYLQDYNEVKTDEKQKIDETNTGKEAEETER